MTEKSNKEKAIEMGLQKKKAKWATPTWEEIGKMFGYKGETVRDLVKKELRKTGELEGRLQAGKTKVLVLSDLHIPDHQEQMILDTVEKYKYVDLIILNGDILDCKAVSAWYDEDISILDHEMQIAHRLLVKMRQLTSAKIILVKGNHEQRVNKHYAQNSKAMGTAVVETEILYKLANGFDIKYIKQKQRVHYDPIENVEYIDGRTFVYGDLIANHPSSFSRLYMQTSSKMWEGKLKNKYGFAKCVLIGHSHQLGMFYAENGVMIIETGCTCNPARYADMDDRPYKIQQYGAVYLEMQDDKVVHESVKIIYLGNDNEKLNHIDTTLIEDSEVEDDY